MKKGFTLVELLAVIVILAVVALITVPVVNNVIKESEESAAMSAAELYLDAIENSIMYEKLENGLKMKDGLYKVMEDGNLCFGSFSSTTCNGTKIGIESSGQLPSDGIIKFANGKITRVSLVYDDLILKKEFNNEFVFSDDEYLKYFESSDFIDSSNKNEKYGKVIFDPGDGDRTWYLLEETKDSFTLMLNENLPNPDDIYGKIDWYETELPDYQEDNNYGPITVLTKLNSITRNWTNVNPIDSYTYINSAHIPGSDGEEPKDPIGYKSLDIKNGVTTITNHDGSTSEVPGVARARLITFEELIDYAVEFNPNYKLENMKNFLSEENNFAVIKQMLYEEFNLEANNLEEAISMLANIMASDGVVGFGENYFTYYYVMFMVVVDAEALTYNLDLPPFLYTVLGRNDDSGSYWTLSTFGQYYALPLTYSACDEDKTCSFVIPYGVTDKGGIRPIITVNK